MRPVEHRARETEMRQLLIYVPQGQGKQVLAIAGRQSGVNLACFSATSSDGPVDVVSVHLSNEQVGRFIGEVQQLPNPRVTLIPQGVMSLRPPAEEAAQQVTDVSLRSPMEVFLGGLQSVGSWKGFLGYAAAAGIIVWIGLFTNTVYLLIAAMLIAPFAGPAMNTAIATARGDWQLLRRTLVRYVVALAVTIVVAALLSLLLQQETTTSLMVDTSNLSNVAVLLPLVAGAAGALNLVQSERSSLVTGAGVGMLVAASLAPPAGLLGMAAALGEWDMVRSALFVLVLQLVGINLSGALVFRLAGLQPEGPRYQRGKQQVFTAAIATTFLVLAGLLTWQFWNPPDLQRSSRAQRAEAEIRQVITDSPLADVVDTNVRFTEADIQGENTLLGVIYVQRRPGVTQPDEAIRSELTQTIQQRLLEQGLHATPLIAVNVLDAPAQSSSGQ